MEKNSYKISLESNKEQLTDFLEQNKGQISNRVDLKKLNSFVLTTQDEDIKLAGQIIKEGGLVGFPTETVYGLGANTFSEEAIKSIFHAKERPYNDPIISHVSGVKQALGLIDTSEDIISLFKYLAEKLWPGPLTVVMKANLKKVPKVHTGGTGFLGVRCPNNKIAQKLIEYAGVPIGAPSANLFSHVSPTSPIHVFNDLYNKNIYLLNGQETPFGIESTVCKINKDKEGCLSIMVLRNGSLSPKMISQAIAQSEKYKQVQVYTKKKHFALKDDVDQEAPGQLVKHYAPNIETYLIKFTDTSLNEKHQLFDLDLSKSVFIDFKDLSVQIKGKVLQYFNLSEKGDMKEAMGNLYKFLRKSENIEQAQTVLISCIDSISKEGEEAPDFLETVYDKTFRASSGRILTYLLKDNKCQLDEHQVKTEK